MSDLPRYVFVDLEPVLKRREFSIYDTTLNEWLSDAEGFQVWANLDHLRMDDNGGEEAVVAQMLAKCRVPFHYLPPREQRAALDEP